MKRPGDAEGCDAGRAEHRVRLARGSAGGAERRRQQPGDRCGGLHGRPGWRPEPRRSSRADRDKSGRGTFQAPIWRLKGPTPVDQASRVAPRIASIRIAPSARTAPGRMMETADPRPRADPGALADHHWAVDADPRAQVDPGADQHRGLDLGAGEIAGGTDPGGDLGRAGVDLDLSGKRVDAPLAQLVEVADVVPVGVDLVGVKGDVGLEQRRGRRPSPSRRSPADPRARRACCARPRRGSESKISELEHVDAAVGQIGERLGGVGLLLKALDAPVGRRGSRPRTGWCR